MWGKQRNSFSGIDMADFIDHLNQAKHNLGCATKFLNDCQCRDWAITAAFYSALHFVEAGFTTITDIVHSDLKRPEDENAHSFRTRMVKDKYGKECWMSYRKLFNASYNVRYLALSGSQVGNALSYYDHEDVIDFINKDVTKVRQEVQSHSGLNLS
jgi:hypothetical protein